MYGISAAESQTFLLAKLPQRRRARRNGCFRRLVMTQPGEIDGSGATNDSKFQSSDSQEDSKDGAQSDCSEMVGFLSLPHCAVLR